MTRRPFYRRSLLATACAFSISASGPLLTAVTQPSSTAVGPVIREQEPNHFDAPAMLVQPGMTVDAALTAGIIPGAATDQDRYRVPVASPGLYTITVTPTVPECEYWVGLPDLRRARGPSTMTVELTGQSGRTHYTLRYGGRPEDRSTTSMEPRELLIMLDTQAYSATSERGIQCVAGGPWYREVPYRLTITAGRPALTVNTPPAPPPVAPPPTPSPVAPPASAGAVGKVAPAIPFGEPAVIGQISNIVTASDVRRGVAVDATDSFGPDVNPIHVWFRLSGFAPGTKLDSRWTYLGGSAPLVIGTGEFTIAPTNDYGTFSYELAAGKRWPAGGYRIEVLLDGAMLGSATFAVRSAQSSVPSPNAAPSVPSSTAVPSPSSQSSSAAQDERAYQLGVEAALRAQDDPANAESIVAERYRQVLDLPFGDLDHVRLTDAFRRGFRSAISPPKGGP